MLHWLKMVLPRKSLYFHVACSDLTSSAWKLAAAYCASFFETTRTMLLFSCLICSIFPEQGIMAGFCSSEAEDLWYELADGTYFMSVCLEYDVNRC